MEGGEEIHPEELARMSSDALWELGCAMWDDAEETLWLLPGEWYDRIPDGTRLVNIFGDEVVFRKGETNSGIRFGMLAYGFLKRREE
jgi:hypothetical protein